MKTLAMLLAIGFAFGPSAQDSDEDALIANVKLKNGSQIRGKLTGMADVQLKTKYGTLRIPIKDIRSLKWGEIRKEERDTISTVNGVFRGWIEGMTTVQIDTGYGKLKVPPGAIKYLRLWRKGQGLGDAFESGSLDRWTRYGGNWQVKDGKLKATTTGSYSNVLLFKEDPGDSYTIEVEISGNNMVGLLWHAQNQTNAVGLWIYPSQVSVFSGSNTYYSATLATWTTGVPFGPYTVRIEVKGTSATVTLNDKKLGSVTTPLGKGKVGMFLYQGTATIDNFRILQN